MGDPTTNMAPVLSSFQYDLIYNMASLGLASMGASTAFFFLRVGSMHEKYKTALCITGLVTFIAMYHYFRIFNSFEKAYTPCESVDWFLTVPMLLIEIILVMGLSPSETKSRCTPLGVSAALMILFGYPGEVTGEIAPRMLFWCISMVPFCYIVYT